VRSSRFSSSIWIVARRAADCLRRVWACAVAPSPAHLCGQQLGIDLVLVRLQEVLKANDVSLDLLEDCETAVQAELPRLGYVIVLRFFPQHEEPRLAGLLVIRPVPFWAAANGGVSDSVGISEVNFGRGHRLAILHLHERQPVLAPDFPEGISFGQPGAHSVAVARHRFRADGVQRHQDVIVPLPETGNPVPWRAWPGVSDRLRSSRCSFDERAE